MSLGILRAGKAMTVPLKVGNLAEAAEMMAARAGDKLGADVRPDGLYLCHRS